MQSRSWISALLVAILLLAPFGLGAHGHEADAAQDQICLSCVVAQAPVLAQAAQKAPTPDAATFAGIQDLTQDGHPTSHRIESQGKRGPPARA